jgi:4-hydroxy-tetrahydrodipicolinate synthase
MIHFGKISTAMVTPFNQKGDIDFINTTKLIEHLIETGTESIVVAGTTGESPTLSKKEKVELFKHVVKVVNGRVPIIAGTGSNNTRESIALTIEAEKVGVDAIMIVAPYYNKPNQEGLFLHFEEIAKATSLPLMVYNIPGRSVVNISPDTIVRLSKIPNIVAVKEASGNLDAMSEIIAKTEEDFLLYSGDDGLTLPVLSIGGTGIVSVASHVIGLEMKEMIEAFDSNDTKKAAKLHQQLLPLMRSLFEAPSPVPVKKVLQWKGIDTGPVRLPLIPLTEREEAELKKYFYNI